MIEYPTETALEVAARRPDLALGDDIAAVLTAAPALTADAVIDILDDARDYYLAEQDDAMLAARKAVQP